MKRLKMHVVSHRDARFMSSGSYLLSQTHSKEKQPFLNKRTLRDNHRLKDETELVKCGFGYFRWNAAWCLLEDKLNAAQGTFDFEANSLKCAKNLIKKYQKWLMRRRIKKCDTVKWRHCTVRYTYYLLCLCFAFALHRAVLYKENSTLQAHV